MLSGVGPADELARFGIPVVVDLPVGANFQDHPLLTIVYRTGERSLFGAGNPNDMMLAEAEEDAQKFGPEICRVWPVRADIHRRRWPWPGCGSVLSRSFRSSALASWPR
jgi:hypothetical protein